MQIFNQNQIDELAQILKDDGVLCVPTDTVYGVCAQINSKKAYDNLIAVKNRPISKLFPIMCANEKQISDIAIINETAKKLIKAFMPGPITLVMRKKPDLDYYVNNGNDTIAIRMATSKALENLMIKCGSPVFMSSANQSGKPTCKNIDEIKRSCPKISGIMEGNVSFGQESTIVDCSSVENIKILRKGPITIKEINKVLKKGELC